MKDVLLMTIYVIIGMTVEITGKPNFLNFWLHCDTCRWSIHVFKCNFCSAFDSDELNCWSANDGNCYIPARARCDGVNDCRKNFDERNC